MLLVGNHTLMGVLDAPLLWAAMWERREVLLRSLGDHMHFNVPGWRDVMKAFGVVPGTRETCATLMQEGAAILVFPGGAREVTKRKSERYQLIWGKRSGFARMAVDNDCPIVPFGAVGMDDAYDFVLDPDDLRSSPMGPLLDKAVGDRADLLPPVLKGVGGTLIPRPERIYFGFGEPILPADFDGDHEGRVWAVREAARQAVEGRIAFLLHERDHDPHRSLKSRMATMLARRRKR